MAAYFLRAGALGAILLIVVATCCVEAILFGLSQFLEKFW